MAQEPRILVVADPAEAERIAGCLGEAGLGQVETGAGNDDTLDAYLRAPADVIVLRTTLAAGDALSFTTALREEAPIPPTVVLVGDQEGPVRTALDALDYRADRFLQWPPNAAALGFAVRACLEVNKEFDKPPTTVGGVARMAEVAMGMSAAGAAHVSDVGPAPAAEEKVTTLRGWIREEGPSFEDDDPGVAAHAIASKLGDQLSGFFASAVNDLIRSSVDSVLEAAVADLRRSLSMPAVAPPPDVAPMREPTQILAAGPPATTTPPDATLGGEDASAQVVNAAAVIQGGEDDAFSAAPTTHQFPEDARTGTFVKELRQKMNDIERRLFGESDDASPSQDEAPPPEVDLDTLGVDTVPGDEQETSLRFHEAEVLTDAATIADDPGRHDDATTIRRSGSVESMRGDLREEDTAQLMARLYRERFSGKVSFRRGEAARAVYLEDGRPVFATSNLAHDRMGDLLYREGKITREQYAESRNIVAETGRRMGEILVEMGFLKRRELLPAVRRHVEDVVYSLFAWDDGEWSTQPGEAASGEKIRLAAAPAALIFEGIRRKMPLDRLQRRLGPSTIVISPVRDDDGRSPLDALIPEADFTPEEQTVLVRFDGRSSIGDIVAHTGAPETEVYHLAYGLVVLGWARVFEEGRDTTDSGRATEGATSPRLGGAADARIDRERVLAKHAHAVEADYFTVLGVRRDATGFEIRRAYEGARRDYAPDSFPVDVQSELQRPLADIAEVLDEAYHVLRDDSLRRQYLTHLAG